VPKKHSTCLGGSCSKCSLDVRENYWQVCKIRSFGASQRFSARRLLRVRPPFKLRQNDNPLARLPPWAKPRVEAEVRC
jgi:hypothetical protein